MANKPILPTETARALAQARLEKMSARALKKHGALMSDAYWKSAKGLRARLAAIHKKQAVLAKQEARIRAALAKCSQ